MGCEISAPKLEAPMFDYFYLYIVKRTIYCNMDKQAYLSKLLSNGNCILSQSGGAKRKNIAWRNRDRNHAVWTKKYYNIVLYKIWIFFEKMVLA